MKGLLQPEGWFCSSSYDAAAGGRSLDTAPVARWGPEGHGSLQYSPAGADGLSLDLTHVDDVFNVLQCVAKLPTPSGTRAQTTTYDGCVLTETTAQ